MVVVFCALSQYWGPLNPFRLRVFDRAAAPGEVRDQSRGDGLVSEALIPMEAGHPMVA